MYSTLYTDMKEFNKDMNICGAVMASQNIYPNTLRGMLRPSHIELGTSDYTESLELPELEEVLTGFNGHLLSDEKRLERISVYVEQKIKEETSNEVANVEENHSELEVANEVVETPIEVLSGEVGVEENQSEVVETASEEENLSFDDWGEETPSEVEQENQNETEENLSFDGWGEEENPSEVEQENQGGVVDTSNEEQAYTETVETPSEEDLFNNEDDDDLDYEDPEETSGESEVVETPSEEDLFNNEEDDDWDYYEDPEETSGEVEQESGYAEPAEPQETYAYSTEELLNSDEDDDEEWTVPDTSYTQNEPQVVNETEDDDDLWLDDDANEVSQEEIEDLQEEVEEPQIEEINKADLREKLNTVKSLKNKVSSNVEDNTEKESNDVEVADSENSSENSQIPDGVNTETMVDTDSDEDDEFWNEPVEVEKQEENTTETLVTESNETSTENLPKTALEYVKVNGGICEASKLVELYGNKEVKKALMVGDLLKKGDKIIC